MKDYDTLKELVYANSPTGFEDEVQKLFTKLIDPYVDKTYQDKIGNVYAEIIGHKDMPTIMVNAHCDSIGFIVKYIGDSGFIYTQDLPGTIATDYRMLPGTDVIIQSRKTNKLVKGCFVPPRPIHTLDDEELFESEPREDLAIDIGAHSKKQASLHISLGDYVTLEPNLNITEIGKRLIGTSLDDRIGLYCLIEIAKNVSKIKTKKKPTIVLVSTVCEENFIGAAGVAAKNVNPDISLTIDTTIATDQIVSDADFAVSKKYGWITLDGGFTLTRGFAITDKIFLTLEKLCETNNIPYQVEVGTGSAECEQIQPSGFGVATALLSIPVRNLHSRIETASIHDTENLIKVAILFIKQAK